MSQNQLEIGKLKAICGELFLYNLAKKPQNVVEAGRLRNM